MPASNNTKQALVLSLTAASGELSPEALARILPRQPYRYKVLQALHGQKLLRTYARDRVKGYRLTRQAKRLLIRENPVRYELLFQGSAHTNAYVSDLPRRLRLHRISETLAMMQLGRVAFHRDAKAALFRLGVPSDEKLPLPAFYLAKEVQALGDAAIKIRNARMVGVLLGEEQFYLVYNTGGTVMRWTPASELRAQVLLTEFFGRQLLWHQYDGKAACAILLGQDIALAEKLLLSRGGTKHQFFTLDDTFAHFHYLPNTPEGDTVLQLLIRPRLHTALNAALAKTMGPKSLGANFEYDATTADGSPVLFAWDFDMIRVQNFFLGIQARELHGIVVAFEFQAEALRHYFGVAAIVRPLSLSKTEAMLL